MCKTFLESLKNLFHPPAKQLNSESQEMESLRKERDFLMGRLQQLEQEGQAGKRM